MSRCIARIAQSALGRGLVVHQMSPESTNIWSQFQILANLRKINYGMGHATARMLAYRIEHGELPRDQLREMATLLEATARMISRFADNMDSAGEMDTNGGTCG
jgi:hypothetical protein